ncbi:MAG: primase-helicase zinc-binding domain-containing protein [Acidithiobacillus sp.]
MLDMNGIDRVFTGLRDEPLYGRVKDYLRGGDRWPWLLTRFGIPASALKGKNCPCPGCGGKDRFLFDNKDGTGSFLCSQGTGEVLAGTGWALLEHVYGWSFERALEEVARVALVDFAPKSSGARTGNYGIKVAQSALPQALSLQSPGVPQIIHWGDLAEEPQRRYDYLMQVFRESIPLPQLDGTGLQIVRNYWLSRGMGTRFRMPSHLHFHPNLPDRNQHWSGPALIAWVTRLCDGASAFADRHIVGMQRIWLNPELQHGLTSAKQSKAPIELAKKSFGIIDQGMIGSSVHLYGSEQSRIRVIGEGIETVLSWLRIQSLQGTLTESVEAHACLGTSQIRNWFAPTDKPVWLLQDNDPAGVEAAQFFLRLHPDTRILTPPQGCNDFNDYLMTLIPSPSHTRSASPCLS